MVRSRPCQPWRIRKAEPSDGYRIRRMLGLGTLARVAGELRRDVAAAHERDPAARGVTSLEVLAAWPGVHALLAPPRRPRARTTRASRSCRARSPTSTRALTGIEIHPAARIGEGLFIDHGDGRRHRRDGARSATNVTLYQGVTLGGTGFATGKRHPTVQDNVTIGSGAKLLGPITIGHGSKIGANSRRHHRRAAELARSSATRATRCGSRASGPRAPTPTGSTCPTPSPTRSRALASRSARSSERGSPSCPGEPSGAGARCARCGRCSGPNPAGG